MRALCPKRLVGDQKKMTPGDRMSPGKKCPVWGLRARGVSISKGRETEKCHCVYT